MNDLGNWGTATKDDDEKDRDDGDDEKDENHYHVIYFFFRVHESSAIHRATFAGFMRFVAATARSWSAECHVHPRSANDFSRACAHCCGVAPTRWPVRCAASPRSWTVRRMSRGMPVAVATFVVPYFFSNAVV